MQNLTTTGEVIDALGGNAVVAEMTKAKNKNVIYNWRAAGKFPANTYILFQSELRHRNLTAPDRLWAMRPTLVVANNKVRTGKK